MDWLNDNAPSVIAFLTLVLVLATVYYAWTTQKALRLAREQFEREWRPYVHLLIRHVGPPPGRGGVHDAEIQVTNLAKPAVLLTGLQLRIGEPGSERTAAAALNEPLLGGESKPIRVGGGLVRALQNLGEVPKEPPSDVNWTGRMAVCVTFRSIGGLETSEWVGFNLVVRSTAVVGLVPDLGGIFPITVGTPSRRGAAARTYTKAISYVRSRLKFPFGRKHPQP